MNYIHVNEIKLKRSNINYFPIDSGRWVGIVGPADSGKTALLLSFIGQKIDNISFNRHSDLEVSDIGFIPSNPRLLFSGFKSNLFGEIKLSAQFVGKKIINIDEIVYRYKLENLLLRDPFSLSGGEMLRAAMAIVAAKQPYVWLFDQIYDWLDNETINLIHELIEEELALGHAFVETHVYSPSWAEKFDIVYFLDNEENVVSGDYITAARKISNNNLLSEISRISLRLEADLGVDIQHHDRIDSIVEALRILNPKSDISNSVKKFDIDYLLKATQLSFSYPDGVFTVGPINVNFKKGEIIAIAGKNGSGKTTFLQCLANLLYPVRGKLEILESSPTRRQWEWAAKAFFCFQNPDDQLYLPSVREEIEKTLDVLNRQNTDELEIKLDTFGLTPYLSCEPYQLARPIRRMICLASGLISSSPVILLDEPTSGLDIQQRNAICHEINKMAKMGFTFAMISHDFSFIGEMANRILIFSDGQLVANTEVFPWPLYHVPPLIRISMELGLEIQKYSDLVNIFRS